MGKRYYRISWKNLHKQGYGKNNCIFCGGKCTDKKSIVEWEKLNYNLELAGFLNDTESFNYYMGKIQKLGLYPNFN